MTRLRSPVWATGVVPAYDQLRMASFGGEVMIGPLRVRNGDLLMADQGGVIRIPRESVDAVLGGMADVPRARAVGGETIARKPGLTAAELRAWYASNEPEFLGDEEA